MPAVLASSARVDGTACPSVLLFAFSMGPRAPPDQGGMSLPPLAVTDRETISGLCVKTRETEEWGRSGGRGTRYTHYSASRLPQNSTGPHPEFPNLTPPLLPVKRLGRVWSWSGRSAHRPGLLPHKDTLLVSEKKLPFCFPVAFLTRPTTFLTDLSAWRGRSQIPPSLGTVAEDKQRSS